MKRSTKKVFVGNVAIGGDAPVTIQSMTNTDIQNIDVTLAQIEKLSAAGCDLVRVAVPKIDAVKSFAVIKKRTSVPLIADVHFNHKIALAALDAGADKIRINPGNIGGKEKLREVVQKAVACKVPIRIGVNSGSLEKDILESEKGPTVNALVKSALRNIDMCREFGAADLVLSIKSSNVLVTVEAYEKISAITDVPLHVGLTEAGSVKSGSIKSAVALGILLRQGIGDTIRVSLTGDPLEEIPVARLILKSLGLISDGPEIISCPTCGRTKVELTEIVNKIESEFQHLDKPLKIAIMGCEVNGPGEARDADVGVAFGKNSCVLFRKGELIKKVELGKVEETLREEIEQLS